MLGSSEQNENEFVVRTNANISLSGREDVVQKRSVSGTRQSDGWTAQAAFRQISRGVSFHKKRASGLKGSRAGKGILRNLKVQEMEGGVNMRIIK